MTNKLSSIARFVKFFVLTRITNETTCQTCGLHTYILRMITLTRNIHPMVIVLLYLCILQTAVVTFIINIYYYYLRVER